MTDLNKLSDPKVREAILLAEVAAWLHNLGKLEPRFLVNAIDGETPDNLPFTLRIPPTNSGLEGYSFRRFTAPSVLKSEFPYTSFAGVLYFPEASLRQKVIALDEQLKQIRSDLQGSALSGDQRRRLGMELDKLKREKQQTATKMVQTEKSNWHQLEYQFEQCSIVSNWTLGALLTMFWESEWFDKPQIENYRPGSEDDPDYQRTPKSTIQLKPGFSMDLPALLLLCHGEISGQEKKGLDKDGLYVNVDKYSETNLTLQNLRLSTAFGFERDIDWQKWQEKRKQILKWVLEKWNTPLQIKSELTTSLQPLSTALGDTQRPINEISLWDYSAATAALFKTAVAQAEIMKQVPTPASMRWRLVSVRLDAFDFLFQVSQLSDLIARKRLLADAYQVIAHLLEIEVPLGAQVYTDEHGLVFVLPEMHGWSDEHLRDELTSLILAALEDPQHLSTLQTPPALYGITDVRPLVTVEPAQRGKNLNLQVVLSRPLMASNPPAEQVVDWWSNRIDDRCMVCGLRPVGYIEPGLPSFVTKVKAKERHLCGICLARRGRRSQAWAKQWQNKKVTETIWINEVADMSERFALVVGRFDLDDWLNGILVRSLAIGTDNTGRWLTKPPTFARIHRVWRTTKEFWGEVQQKTLSDLQDDRRRLILQIYGQPDLGEYHTYELHLGPTSMSVVWVPPQDGQAGYLVSTDNLQYVAKQLGAGKEIMTDSALSSIFIEDYINDKWVSGKREPRLHNPEGTPTERQRNFLRGHKITGTTHQDTPYSPVIPILAEPQVFMALVPADKAMEVAKAIKTKYAREMGKVRNRLPLHLGLVFAGRRIPLQAVLDAGRAMLKIPSQVQTWKVASKHSDGQTLTLELKRRNRRITWKVPLKMGDGSTDDQWYPYVFVRKVNLAQHKRRFQLKEAEEQDTQKVGSVSEKHAGQWLVHAGDLQDGDAIRICPSTFDFEFLDSTARRFDIYYDDEGRRPRLTRPYYLEDMGRLEKVWNDCRELKRSQFSQMLQTIESARERWNIPLGAAAEEDAVFCQFVEDTLANAHWPKGTEAHPTVIARSEATKQSPPAQQKIALLPAAARNDRQALITAAARGELADLAELHLEILKENMKGEAA